MLCGFLGATTAVDVDQPHALYAAMDALYALGARGILVTDILACRV